MIGRHSASNHDGDVLGVLRSIHLHIHIPSLLVGAHAINLRSDVKHGDMVCLVRRCNVPSRNRDSPIAPGSAHLHIHNATALVEASLAALNPDVRIGARAHLM